MKAVVGNRLGDIGAAIQEYAESKGYGVVRDLVGHGVGPTMHEEPMVPTAMVVDAVFAYVKGWSWRLSQ